MRHFHVAERCKHGETKSTCEHQLPWSQYRVREVQCETEFCPEWARLTAGFEELMTRVRAKPRAEREAMAEQVRVDLEFYKQVDGDLGSLVDMRAGLGLVALVCRLDSPEDARIIPEPVLRAALGAQDDPPWTPEELADKQAEAYRLAKTIRADEEEGLE